MLKQSEVIKTIPEHKTKLVEELAKKMKSSSTVLIASTNGLPSSQFHEIKKALRKKSEIKVAKKSIILRAISATERGALQNLKKYIGADIALFFSNIDPFELSSLLSENKSATRAKAGDIAPEDINVEPGPTNLIPGPAISELSGVGLKVAVEGGKLAIKLPATIVKQGEIIKENVASVMGKLGIAPIKVGFEPIAAYDSKEDKVYSEIKIDKKKTLDELREYARKSLGFAINMRYISKETIKHLIYKALREEKAFESIIEKNSNSAESRAIETQHNTEIREEK